MRKKTSFLIFATGFYVVIAFSFSVMAAIDAPHNESYSVSCGTCHGQGLLNSPFWGGSMSYDGICTNCHKVSSCPYVDTNVLAVETHTDFEGNVLAECRTCHNPHYQKQKIYKNTNAGNLYLATGTITNCSYEPPAAPETVGTSTLIYSTITYKDGWDEMKLIGKTDTCRRTIIFPNVNKLGYSFPVTGIDEGSNTIMVRGDARPVYQYISYSTFAVMYGQFIRDSIYGRQVKFFDKKGSNSFADGDNVYDGVCEVCHTETSYHRYDGSGSVHYNSTQCISCHSHIEGSGHEGAHSDCGSCHSHVGGAGTYLRHEPLMDYVIQENGSYDTLYSQLEEPDCRSCHGASVADRHHLLGLTCGQCHEIADVIRDCLTSGCHSWDDVITNGWHHNSEVSGTGNCRACHNPTLLSENSPVGCITDDEILVMDMIPTPFACQNCHWPQDVTVGGHPLPNEAGDPYGKAIKSSQDTHHMGFLGNVSEPCYVCHSCSGTWDDISWDPCNPNLIRACESCHSKETLHAIHEFPNSTMNGWEAKGFHVPPENDDETDLEPDTYRLFTGDEMCIACHVSAYWRGPICQE